MNETEHLLTVVSEECCEIGQRACKAIRFGLYEVQPGQQEDNKRRLEREIADLLGTARMLGLTVREEDIIAKIEKLKKYMKYSREMGTLEKPAIPACANGSSCFQPGGCGNPDGNDWCSNCGAVLATKEGRSYPSCDSCS